MSLWGDSPNVYYNIQILNKIKVRSSKRIGPHDHAVICFLFGALLSDAYAERHGNGTRIVQQQESKNREFISWYHKFLYIKGYTSSNIEIKTRIGKNSKKIFYIKCNTWTYTSFNWIHESFYKNSIKIVPINQEEYLSPLTLAIWIMGDGSKVSGGCKQSTNSFTKSDCEKICILQKKKYNIYATVNSAGTSNQWVIYIWKKSMSTLISIVKPYMVKSMLYKQHIKNL